MVSMQAKLEPSSLLKLKNERLRLYGELMELRHPPGSKYHDAEVIDQLHALIRSRDAEIQRRGNSWWSLVQRLEPVRRRPSFQWTVGMVQGAVEKLTFRGILPERIGRWRLLDCLIDLSE